MREITRIVVHCSATPPDRNVTVGDIRRWHTDPKPRGNGWRRGGYQRVIERDGKTSQLEPDHVVANGVRGFNKNSIHICLVGGVDHRKRPEDNFTDAQKDALRSELRRYTRKYPDAEVVGHRDLDPGKACPSIDVEAFWEGER